MKKLSGMLQNAMYQPTTLVRNLHKERAQAVLSLDGNNNNGGGDRAEDDYGSIHLRMLFLKKEIAIDPGGGGNNSTTLAEEVTHRVFSCLRHNFSSTITKWWILSDDPNVARHVSGEMPGVVRHGYNDDFEENNLHSLRASKGIYDHVHMAPSVMDWMVLHESRVSLAAGSGTAFGETGSRGNGKYLHRFSEAEEKDCSSIFGRGYYKADDEINPMQGGIARLN